MEMKFGKQLFYPSSKTEHKYSKKTNFAAVVNSLQSRQRRQALNDGKT